MKKKATQVESAPSLVIVGCGNVAWHLAKGFLNAGVKELMVCNHRPNPVLDDFRFQLKCKTAVGIENMPLKASFYFICVPDKFIAEVAAKIQLTNPQAILVHCSGSTSLSELGERVQGTAVFYPLQSFSRQSDIQWQETPLLLEASDKNTLKSLKALASLLSPLAYDCKSEERLHLHLCAVLVNNFTNALFTAAEEHLLQNKTNFDLSLFLPLIQTGVSKLSTMKALAAQTGPAKRGDKKTMHLHLDLLDKHSSIKKIYKDMSLLIKEQQHGRS